MNDQRRLGCLKFLVPTLLVLAPTALASTLIGKVLISGKPVADAVISIEGVRLEGPTDARVYIIDHRNLNFVPHVLVVRAGATVRFENSDGMPCNIYSISPAGTFVLRRKDSKPMTVTFDRPGIIEVRCADHDRIYAYVVVKENPYFALADAKGRYKISKLPPGRYTLQAWYEGKVIESRTVDVRNAKLKVDFKAIQPQPLAFEPQPLGTQAPVTDFIGNVPIH